MVPQQPERPVQPYSAEVDVEVLDEDAAADEPVELAGTAAARAEPAVEVGAMLASATAEVGVRVE